MVVVTPVVPQFGFKMLLGWGLCPIKDSRAPTHDVAYIQHSAKQPSKTEP
jgi:hypothetical protein